MVRQFSIWGAYLKVAPYIAVPSDLVFTLSLVDWMNKLSFVLKPLFFVFQLIFAFEFNFILIIFSKLKIQFGKCTIAKNSSIWLYCNLFANSMTWKSHSKVLLKLFKIDGTFFSLIKKRDTTQAKGPLSNFH